MIWAAVVVGGIIVVSVSLALERYARRNGHKGRYFVERWTRLPSLFTALGVALLFVYPITGFALLAAGAIAIGLYLWYYRSL